jgi:hypothetical protein
MDAAAEKMIESDQNLIRRDFVRAGAECRHYYRDHS